MAAMRIPGVSVHCGALYDMSRLMTRATHLSPHRPFALCKMAGALWQNFDSVMRSWFGIGRCVGGAAECGMIV